LLNSAIDLDTHIADIVNILSWKDLRDVVLVGHSYGGLIITSVADKAAERIKHLVYLDAHVSVNGQSLFDLMSEKRVAYHIESVQEFTECRVVTQPPAEFWELIDVQDKQWVNTHCSSHHVKTMRQKNKA